MRASRVAALLAAAAAFPLAAGEFRPDAVSDPVVCAKSPVHGYALYLPPQWSADRPFPILYVHDVRGRGRLALEVFRPAAARLGWILASSNESEAGADPRRNAEALEAMWADTHASLNVDPRKRFVAGFSGTSRFAAVAGLAYGGRIAGVFGAGAGFAAAVPPRAGMPFAYFGAVGDEDFNLSEMRTLDRRLDELGARHRLVVFDGGHRWPPAEIAFEGLSWLDACASGECPAASESPEDARRRAARDAEEDSQDRRALAALDAELNAVLAGTPLPSADRAAARLDLDGLRRRAEASPPSKAKAAKRLLAWVKVRAGIELAAGYDAKSDSPRAALCRALAERAASSPQ